MSPQLQGSQRRQPPAVTPPAIELLFVLLVGTGAAVILAGLFS
jgi:hypothetical protein